PLSPYTTLFRSRSTAGQQQCHPISDRPLELCRDRLGSFGHDEQVGDAEPCLLQNRRGVLPYCVLTLPAGDAVGDDDDLCALALCRIIARVGALALCCVVVLGCAAHLRSSSSSRRRLHEPQEPMLSAVSRRATGSHFRATVGDRLRGVTPREHKPAHCPPRSMKIVLAPRRRCRLGKRQRTL